MMKKEEKEEKQKEEKKKEEEEIKIFMCGKTTQKNKRVYINIHIKLSILLLIKIVTEIQENVLSFMILHIFGVSYNEHALFI